jgi:threonine dehydrogenase-like Zn-dependent dehydrogenase
MGAEKVIAMSRHASRQEIAKRFGATHVVAERGDEGAEAVREITDGLGGDAVLECVGNDVAMQQAFAVARPGSTVGFVGVPHGIELPVRRMFQKNIGLAGGMAPVRKYLPELLRLVLDGTIDPGLVFDRTLPLDEVAEGYRAMDEREAIKVLIRP